MNTTPDLNERLPMEEDNLDIKKYFFLILSKWYWFALSIFVGLFISYLVNRYSEPIYSVSASLIIRDEDNSKGLAGPENLLQGLKLVRNTKSVQNEIEILKSYSLAHRAIKDLGDYFRVTYVGVGRRGFKETKLYKSSPIKVNIDTTIGIPYNHPIFITILSKDEYQLEVDGGLNIDEKHRFGEWVRKKPLGFQVVLNNIETVSSSIKGRKIYFILNATNNLTNLYKNKVNISLNDKKGSVLTLSSTGFVSAQEADYINKLMEVYMLSGLEDKNKVAENTVRFINTQLVDVSDSLKRAEHNLEKFRITNKVIDLTAEGSMLFDKEKDLVTQKATIELKRRYYDYLMEYIKKRSNIKDIVAPSELGVDDPQLAVILEQINQTYLQREELLLSTTPGSPALAQINNRLETLNKTLIEKVSSLIDANNLGSRDLEVRFAELDREMLRIPTNQRMLITTQREFDLMNNLFIYLLQKRSDAEIARASNISDNKVLDYALPENAIQIKPQKRLNTTMGLLLGAFLPLSIILLITFLNDKVNDIKEVERQTKIPILGTVGHNKFNTDIPVKEKPKSSISESFRAIRINLQYILRNPDQKVITVTSTISGEGKTFMAANLAAIIAMANKRVLVVGLDLRKPKMQNMFGVITQKGLSTFLIGQDSAEDIILPTDIENLWYAPSGPIPPNPSELIDCPKMDEFIIWAKKNYDFIILDTPPVAIVTDALLTQRFSDCTLFIIRFNYSSRDVLRFVESLYIKEKLKNLGLIINDVEHKKVYGYNYGYAYNYGYSYSSGYGYYRDKNGYYNEEEHPLTIKDRIIKIFK